MYATFPRKTRGENLQKSPLWECVYILPVCVCVVFIRVSMYVPPAAGEDVLPSDPQLHRALSPPVFNIIDSRSNIDRRCGGRKGKIGV